MLRLGVRAADFQAVMHGGLQAGRGTEIARRHAGFHLFGKRMHGGLAEVMTSKQMGGPDIAVPCVEIHQGDLALPKN
jgi:hypothetical protein